MAGDRDTEALGPVEQAVNDELEKLGFTPLTPPGPLRTAAARVLTLAEVYDRTSNSAYLPGLDRQIGTIMSEARLAVQPSAVPRDPGEDPGEDVDDFTRRRQQRGPPSAGSGGN